MFFVVDKPRLKTMLSIVREDHHPRRGPEGGPFLRLEAKDGSLTISGDSVEIEMPATVYEPGVLFLRTTRFRRMLNAIDIKILGTRHLTFQINQDGMVFADVRFGFDVLDMLLYLNPMQAPKRHPGDRFPGTHDQPTDPQGNLF